MQITSSEGLPEWIFRYGKRDFPFQLLRNDIFLSRYSIIIVIYGKEVIRITL